MAPIAGNKANSKFEPGVATATVTKPTPSHMAANQFTHIRRLAMAPEDKTLSDC